MVSDSYYRSLIEAVRQLPVLYDRAHPDFRNVRKRNEAWKLVSETLFKRGFSPNEGRKFSFLCFRLSVFIEIEEKVVPSVMVKYRDIW